MRSLVFLSLISNILSLVPATTVPYAEYILAPTSRVIDPITVLNVTGEVQGAANLVSSQTISSTTFQGISNVVVDFGRNIAGYIAFHVDAISDSSTHQIGVTFSESSLWINNTYCDATQDVGLDFPLVFNATTPGHYEAPSERQRGGFRYITFVHNSSTGSVDISNLTISFTPEPTMVNPANYTGFFNSDNEKINRVWYAGAYTNQLCTIAPDTGSALLVPNDFWYYNATLSNGTSVLVDGAKRDRIVWPGDIFVSGRSIYASTGMSDGIASGLDSLLRLQLSDGQLPYSGDPFHALESIALGEWAWSFTYHLYTLIDIYDYYIFTGDVAYLTKIWPQFKLALHYSLSTIDETGLANVTSSNDWLRFGMGGHNIEANAIFYYTLGLAIEVAIAVNDTTSISNYTQTRDTIATVANTLLWNPATKLFNDNETTTLNPQDGNVWAVVSGLVNTTRAAQISTSLSARWISAIGAPAPEAGETVSPFISGIEIQAHYIASFPERAVKLMEFMWADFMLDDPRMTNSTFIEGYSTTGELVYAPYPQAARISHAHAWGSGPTSMLTRYAVGIILTGPAGMTWTMKPNLGGLGRAHAGFITKLGMFEASWMQGVGESAFNGTIATPIGTSGELIVNATGLSTVLLTSTTSNTTVDLSAEDGIVTIAGVCGGSWTVVAA